MSNDNGLPKTADRRYTLIYALATQDKPTKAQLLALTGTSMVTLRRDLISLRSEFAFEVRLVRPTGRVEDPDAAYYEIHDTGILDISRFLTWWNRKG